MKKTITIIIVLVLLVAGGWYFYSQQEKAESPGAELPSVSNGDNEVPAQENEPLAEEGDPYNEAETVVPIEERNVAMDEDFRTVLGGVFEKEPKLVSTGNILVLSYVVDRVITSEDVSKARSLLEEQGYEMAGTNIEGDQYELNLSAEILEEEYDGNIYVIFWTAEEGENAQKIEVRIL